MSQHRSSSNRSVWLAIILIFAVLVAAGAATLFRVAGANVISTLTGAGMAFVFTVTLSLAASKFLDGQ
jgi:hypothetical protein